MRAQSGRYGYLVYMFQGDAQKMKEKSDRKWNLYGLWTHSSCPVVQYICEESDGSANNFGLELLGHCVPQSNRYSRQAQRRSTQWLVVQNDGVKLEAELVRRNGLAPHPCSIKVGKYYAPVNVNPPPPGLGITCFANELIHQ